MPDFGERRLGWLNGRIVFSKAPLSEVIAELQRRYAVEIRLADASLAGETLTASFTQKSVSEVLDSVCLAMHLRYSQDGDRYTLFCSE